MPSGGGKGSAALAQNRVIIHDTQWSADILKSTTYVGVLTFFDNALTGSQGEEGAAELNLALALPASLSEWTVDLSVFLCFLQHQTWQ